MLRRVAIVLRNNRRTGLSQLKPTYKLRCRAINPPVVKRMYATSSPEKVEKVQPVVEKQSSNVEVNLNPKLRRAKELLAEATALINQDRFKEAYPVLYSALELWNRFEGDPESETAALIQLRLGYLFHQLGDFNKAADYTEAALQLLVKIFTENNRDVGLAFLNYAGLLYNLNRPEDAVENCSKALTIIEQFHKNDICVAIVLSNLAGYYLALEKYSEAREPCSRALKIFIRELGKENEYTKTAFSNMYQVLLKSNDQEGIKHLESVYNNVDKSDVKGLSEKELKHIVESFSYTIKKAEPKVNPDGPVKGPKLYKRQLKEFFGNTLPERGINPADPAPVSILLQEIAAIRRQPPARDELAKLLKKKRDLIVADRQTHEGSQMSLKEYYRAKEIEKESKRVYDTEEKYSRHYLNKVGLTTHDQSLYQAASYLSTDARRDKFLEDMNIAKELDMSGKLHPDDNFGIPKHEEVIPWEPLYWHDTDEGIRKEERNRRQVIKEERDKIFKTILEAVDNPKNAENEAKKFADEYAEEFQSEDGEFRGRQEVPSEDVEFRGRREKYKRREKKKDINFEEMKLYSNKTSKDGGDNNNNINNNEDDDDLGFETFEKSNADEEVQAYATGTESFEPGIRNDINQMDLSERLEGDIKTDFDFYIADSNSDNNINNNNTSNTTTDEDDMDPSGSEFSDDPFGKDEEDADMSPEEAQLRLRLMLEQLRAGDVPPVNKDDPEDVIAHNNFYMKLHKKLKNKKINLKEIERMGYDPKPQSIKELAKKIVQKPFSDPKIEAIRKKGEEDLQKYTRPATKGEEDFENEEEIPRSSTEAEKYIKKLIRERDMREGRMQRYEEEQEHAKNVRLELDIYEKILREGFTESSSPSKNNLLPDLDDDEMESLLKGGEQGGGGDSRAYDPFVGEDDEKEGWEYDLAERLKKKKD